MQNASTNTLRRLGRPFDGLRGRAYPDHRERRRRRKQQRAEGRGGAKYTAEPDGGGEGESLSRCPASCGACGRCCVPGDGCIFEQRYADETRATGNPLSHPSGVHSFPFRPLLYTPA